MKMRNVWVVVLKRRQTTLISYLIKKNFNKIIENKYIYYKK